MEGLYGVLNVVLQFVVEDGSSNQWKLILPLVEYLGNILVPKQNVILRFQEFFLESNSFTLIKDTHANEKGTEAFHGRLL